MSNVHETRGLTASHEQARRIAGILLMVGDCRQEKNDFAEELVNR